MNAGVADQIGTPMDVYDRPASVFVAGFIGSPAMNFLAAKVGQDRKSVDLAGNER
jgi:sn-glycerol 3-phosphate transport system ATP-binding protein